MDSSFLREKLLTGKRWPALRSRRGWLILHAGGDLISLNLPTNAGSFCAPAWKSCEAGAAALRGRAGAFRWAGLTWPLLESDCWGCCFGRQALLLCDPMFAILSPPWSHWHTLRPGLLIAKGLLCKCDFHTGSALCCFSYRAGSVFFFFLFLYSFRSLLEFLPDCKRHLKRPES